MALGMREVRSDGRGGLTVMDIPDVDTSLISIRQGNLHPVQTNFLLSTALSGLNDPSASPVTALGHQLGPAAQLKMIFGIVPMDSTQDLPKTCKPLPLNEITTSYTNLMHSAMKIFLLGLSEDYVPCRLATDQVIFTSSLPQTIISTALLVILYALATISLFRRPVPGFTFSSVASSLLEDSNVLQMMASTRIDTGEEVVLEDYLVASKAGEYGPILHLKQS